MFQLEKIYGKSSDAKAFIKELCRGSLAKPCVAKSNHIIEHMCQLTNYMIMDHVDFISHQSFCQHCSSCQNYTRPRTTGGAAPPGLEMKRLLICSCLILSLCVALCAGTEQCQSEDVQSLERSYRGLIHWDQV